MSNFIEFRDKKLKLKKSYKMYKNKEIQRT